MNDYEKLRKKLNDYFTPKKNKQYARYLFLKMKPTHGETTVAYAARVREKGNECEFGTNCDDRILEHLIQTTHNRTLIQTAINKKWNLTQFLTEAAQMEDTSLQVSGMKIPEDVKKLSRRPGECQPPRSRSGYQKKQPCGYCGQVGTHPKGKNCPAYGKKCSKCQRFNHFATVCRADTPRDSKKGQQHKPELGKSHNDKQQRHIKRTTEESPDSSTSSDDEFFCQAVRHLKQVKKIKSDDKDRTLIVKIDNVDVEVEPDSGAEVNVLDEHQFKALTNRASTKATLASSRTKLNALQSELSVKGEFTATIRNKTCGTVARFIVVKGRINSPPLIGKDTLQELGMLQIREDGTFAEKNDLRIQEEMSDIKAVKEDEVPSPEIKDIADRYSHVFQSIGKIRDNKNGQDFYAKFRMRPEAVPVAQKPIPVAYYLQEPLKKWLEQCLEEEILEEVPEGEPVTWRSPLVVQPKPKFSELDKEDLEPHMIRASVDLRIPNQFMERNRITQSTVVEDFMYKFHNCTVFSKLDMKQGYHQLLLDPESRKIATFSTPWGNMRPKRLIFGAKSSQDLFDEAIYRIFGDIPRCLNQRDDILLGGTDPEEHNKTLETVLQRASDFGITFNPDKCQFGVEEIDFYGHRFTKNGLKPNPDKVRAAKEASPPESKEAVRSFLGMTGYLSKFIPRYSSLTAPLRDLTHKDTKFKWGTEEQEAFEKLKASITSGSTMAYFNPSRPISVRVEASYHEGLSAGLFQETDRGLQPVHYISRTMTDTEKRYSQTEKDALSVHWAKNRFSIYLLGAPRFKIITAHKPLLPLFNKANMKLPPRIEKWVMGMQDVDFELIYEPGKDEEDPLDFLSRHPLPETGRDAVERVIKHVVNAEYAVVMDQIKEETQTDNQLQKLSARIQTGDWERHKKDPDIMPFHGVRHELYAVYDLMFRMDRIIIPTNLQRRVIKAAHHLGHKGMTKAKQMLREKYWWPTMNSMVEQAINKCYDCQVTTRQHRTEPIKSTEIPKKPWDVVAVDFGGPYPDGHYNLLAIDKRTRYPEVLRTHSTAFRPTKDRLKTIFATHGTPRQLESDNGPPFNSKEFAEFAKTEGFHHHRVTPEHARANGEAERFMKLLNKTEQIAHLQGGDSNAAIQEMLTGYRSTPHPATGVTPYEALMNRQVRTKLDHQTRESNHESARDSAVNKRDKEYKQKTKQNAQNKNTKQHNFTIGDHVLLKQKKTNKWSTAFEPAFYTITQIDGSSIAARRITDGRDVYRDASQFKLANALIENDPDEEFVDQEGESDSEEWRQQILQNFSAQPDPGKTVPDKNQLAESNNSNEAELSNSPKTPVPEARPKRNRQRPTYLKDYV